MFAWIKKKEEKPVAKEEASVEEDVAHVEAVHKALLGKKAEIVPKKTLTVKYTRDEIDEAMRKRVSADLSLAAKHTCSRVKFELNNRALDCEVTVYYFDSNDDNEAFMEQERAKK